MRISTLDDRVRILRSGNATRHDRIEYLDRTAWIEAIRYVFSSRWQHVVCDIASFAMTRSRGRPRFMESRWFRGLYFFAASSSFAIRPYSRYICTYIRTCIRTRSQIIVMSRLFVAARKARWRTRNSAEGTTRAGETSLYRLCLTAAFITAVINGNARRSEGVSR